MANLATSPIRRRHSGYAAENDGETIPYGPGDWTSCLFLLQNVPTVELAQCVCLREVASVSDESMSQRACSHVSGRYMHSIQYGCCRQNRADHPTRSTDDAPKSMDNHRSVTMTSD